MRFSGSYVALVTPFHADGSVNFEKLRELVEWHVQQGTDGIVALGTTGESSTMSHEEDDAVARAVIETVNGRIPVICGAGSNSTQTQLEKEPPLSRYGRGRAAAHHAVLQQGERRGHVPPFCGGCGCGGYAHYSV